MVFLLSINRHHHHETDNKPERPSFQSSMSHYFRQWHLNCQQLPHHQVACHAPKSRQLSIKSWHRQAMQSACYRLCFLVLMHPRSCHQAFLLLLASQKDYLRRPSIENESNYHRQQMVHLWQFVKSGRTVRRRSYLTRSSCHLPRAAYLTGKPEISSNAGL